MDVLHRMARELLEKEVLDGAEIDVLVKECSRDSGPDLPTTPVPASL